MKKPVVGRSLMVVSLVMLAALPSAHAQGGISLGVEGDSHINGNLTVGGTITVGTSWPNVITDTNGLIDGSKLQAGTTGSDQLAPAAVTEEKIASTAITTTKIADNAVTTSKLADTAVTPEKLNQTATYLVGKLGIGASAVPYAGIGYGQMALYGETNYLCPNLMLTTSDDNYPCISLAAYSHDNAALRFDAYHGTSSQLSAYSGSNAQIQKYQNSLNFCYAKNKNPGSSLTWSTGLKMNCTTGDVSALTAYGCALTLSPRVLHIDATGKLGYMQSTIQAKENVRDVAQTDTDFIYNLRPVMFDYKDDSTGVRQCGLIAEEVNTVCPRIVSYKREVTESPSSNPNDTTGMPETKVAVSNIPETVNYDKLTVPMLAEMQRLRKRVDALEARLAALEARK